VVDPPAPAGDLKADIDGFTTLEACVAAHAGVDPLVGDALEAIGYDTLLRDACHALDAARARDARRCDDILASSLRARCVATVAEIEGDPDVCPWDLPTRPERGRDPACLALESRDPRPCVAALQAVDRASCEAIATHDGAPCARLVGPDRARCERDTKRWSGVVPAATARPGAADSLRGKATVSGDEDAGAETLVVDSSRGVVLVERIDGAHVVVGPALQGALGFIASSPAAPGSLSLELVIPADSRKARVDRGELRSPRRSTITVDGSRASALSVRVTRFERARGGAIEVTVSGPVGEGLHVDLTVTTFVRDVVKASALFGLPRLGDAGGMR